MDVTNNADSSAYKEQEEALADPSTKSTYEAMITAGYSETTAAKAAKRTVGNSRIQEAITDIMERTGLSDEQLVSVLSEGLAATKVIAANITAPNGEGMKDANGLTKDFVEVPDWQSRLKAVDIGLKLKNETAKNRGS